MRKSTTIRIKQDTLNELLKHRQGNEPLGHTLARLLKVEVPPRQYKGRPKKR